MKESKGKVDWRKGYIEGSQRVKVVDFDMGFGSMVIFMVKWAIASIPAIIILTLIGLLIMTILGIGIGGLASF